MVASLSIIFALVKAILTTVYLTTMKDGKRKDEKVLLKLPLIRDLHKSHIEKPLLNWDSWTRENGPIAIPKLFELIPIVVLNSNEGVTELFSRRSQWYSNRPSSVSMEMITDSKPGKSKFTLMHDYDNELRLHHQILSPSLGGPGALKYQPLIELESTQLIFDLCQAVNASPQAISTETIHHLLERTQSSVILGLHYGLRIPPLDDEMLREVMDLQNQITHVAGNPGLPDMIPALRYLPAFLSPWKRAANKMYAAQVDLNGRGEVSDLNLSFTLATSVSGGIETSPRQVLWLFIAALHKPSFIQKAHATLDGIVGRERLPLFSDRSKLLFIDAIAQELFRWRPVSPGAIPRRADKDDELNGVKIKKGWTLMANAWAIGRDEKVFDPTLGDLSDFVPERWLRRDRDGEEKLRTDLPLPVFGQGRRMCQGKRVAIDGTFLQVACLLWAFDVEVVDDVDPWAMSVTGFMIMPTEVRFKLKPRGDWVFDVIHREWEMAEKTIGKVMGSTADVEST
ncbi:hypothetical protein N7488_005284 [Penicillium malachiteum]|nr:hypothetical protein N7488_005284 [Penicillium malachiteum]